MSGSGCIARSQHLLSLSPASPSSPVENVEKRALTSYNLYIHCPVLFISRLSVPEPTGPSRFLWRRACSESGGAPYSYSS